MKNLIGVYLIAFLLALSTVGCKKVEKEETTAKPDESSPSEEQSRDSGARQACVERDVRFTFPVVDPAVVQNVTPIGGVGGGGTEIVGRSYIHPKAEYEGIAIPIHAPTDMRLIAVTNYLPPGAPNDGSYRSDWSMTFEASCDVTLSLYHVKDVVASIRAQEKRGLQSRSAPEPVAQTVEFKAGEVIGYYIKGNLSIAFDFIVNDLRVTNQFLNQRRYEAQMSNILNIICPYDLYSPAVRDTFLALVADAGGTPFPEYGCGQISRDVRGTLAGQWFLEPNAEKGFGENFMDGDYGSPLPITTMPSGTVQIGHLGAQTDVRLYTNNPTWLAPEAINGSHCYQIEPNPSQPAGYVYVEMVSDWEMRLSYSARGLCPNEFPEENYRTYFR